MGWWENNVTGGPVSAAQGVGHAISGASDFLSDRTAPYHANPYAIDPNAFVNPNAAGDKAAWGAASGAAQGRTGPTIATGPQDQFRAGQGDLISALQASANGTGPSVADAQMKRAMEANLSSAAALQSSQRGVNAGTAARQLQDQQAKIAQDAAGQGMVGRLQEQMAARGQLGDVLSGARGQDIGLATNQAGMGLQQTGLNDELARYYAGLGAQTDLASFAGQQAGQQLGVQNELGNAGINQQASAQNQNFLGNLSGSVAGLGSAALPALLASDEKKKTGIKSGNQDIYDFLDALHAKDYRYKDPGAPGAAPGEQTGVMAQDLEKSPVGAALVVPTPAGKMVDTTHGYGTVLAAAANLHQRVKDLERQLGHDPDAIDTTKEAVNAGDSDSTERNVMKDFDTRGPEEEEKPSVGRQIIDWLMRPQDQIGGIGGASRRMPRAVGAGA